MDIYIYIFVISIALLFCIIRLLRPTVSVYERAFLLVMIISLIYYAYNKHAHYNLSVLRTSDKVGSILNNVKESIDLENEISLPIRKILESDPMLLKTLLALTRYTTYDKDAITQIIKSIILFFELYADILLGVKDTHMIGNLIDIRFSILKRIHSLFVSMPTMKHVKVFEYILLVVQSSTYKSLNVLKNKYGITAYESPLPNNTFDNSFELF
jgi:hypothetical protein